ncbi:hypothetical protein MchiMG62_13190 [Methanoculleus chikugoensis]|uniref:UPF0316 protein MchiMG62_13190 n=2 Tax=Methanoculleus chikugoensis TaxID=118126 RepID=A0ABM7H5N1_9EURY|nr:hypothetical protein MchiMG62_13190 [Methanoculleus chikugoensis]
MSGPAIRADPGPGPARDCILIYPAGRRSHMDFLSAGTLTPVLIPLLVFGARVIDVSLETLRIILLARGGRLIVPAIAFVEILFWIVSLGLVVNEFTNPVYLISYGAGFAAGNYVGILLEERLAMGICVLRVITSEEDRALIDAIRAAGYGVTVVAAEGLHGPCTIFYSVVRRCDLLPIARVVEEMSPCAFCTVEDVRSTTHGTFPRSGEGTWSGIQRRAVRIGK